MGVEQLGRDAVEYRLGQDAPAAVAVEEARLDLADLEDNSLRVGRGHALQVTLEVGPVARNEVFGLGEEHEVVREDHVVGGQRLFLLPLVGASGLGGGGGWGSRGRVQRR